GCSSMPTPRPQRQECTHPSSRREGPHRNSDDVAGYRIASRPPFQVSVSPNRSLDGSDQLPSPPETGASTSITSIGRTSSSRLRGLPTMDWAISILTVGGTVVRSLRKPRD